MNMKSASFRLIILIWGVIIWGKHLKRIQGNMQKETIRELLTNYEAMMRNRVFVSLGIKQRNSRNAATRSLEPSISLGALMTLHRARLQLAKLHTVIIRTAYTMTWLDHGNNSSANASITFQKASKCQMSTSGTGFEWRRSTAAISHPVCASRGGFYKDVIRCKVAIFWSLLHN